MEAVLASGSGRRPGLSPVQVMAAGLLLVAVVVAVWAVQERQSPVTEEVELLAGTVVSAADLAVMEAVFDRAELKDYRVQEGAALRRPWSAEPISAGAGRCRCASA
jgi:hypothetical protein